MSAVAAGLYDVVLVTGVEKMTSQQTPRVAEILAMAGECCTEGKAGATFPALFAMIAHRHMYQYGTKREHLAAVAVKNHANGAKNPDAHMRKVITLEQAHGREADRGSPDGLRLLARQRWRCFGGHRARSNGLDELTDKPVQVLGIAQTSDYVALDRKEDITVLQAVRPRRQRRIRWRVSVRPTSSSPRYTIASPSPRFSRLKILASFRKGRADRIPRQAAPRSKRSVRSIQAAD